MQQQSPHPGMSPIQSQQHQLQQHHHQQQQQQQQAQQQQQQQQQESKLDHISQSKLLIAKLKQVLADTMRTAALAIGYSGKIDNATLKPTDIPNQEFERNFERFLFLCDLVEYNLTTALECCAQSACSQRYTPLPVGTLRPDGPPQGLEPLSYNQYIRTIRAQIHTADEMRTMLQEAAQLTAAGPGPESQS